MASDLSILLLFSTFLFFLLYLISALPDTCPAMVCKPGEPEIRYPFRLKQLQPDERCGYPGFDLSCNGRNRTTLSLPLSGKFIVDSVIYRRQVIRIEDPDGCLPKRLQNFNISGSSWTVKHYTNYTLFRCPLESRAPYVFLRVPCLDGHDYSVVAVAMDDLATRINKQWKWLRCNFSQTISVPTTDDSLIQSELAFPSSIVLSWDGLMQNQLVVRFWNDGTNRSLNGRQNNEITKPTDIERRTRNELKFGRLQGNRPKNKMLRHDLLCTDVSPPPPESSKNSTSKQRTAVAIVVCLTIIVGLIALMCRFPCLAQHDQTNPSSPPDRALALVDRLGMETPVIESYPTTCVGDAGGLMPRDNSCSICLSEYKSKEVLRTLPECKHSFHAHCIDTWLKRNPCCPMCRSDQGYAIAKSIVPTQGEEEEDFPYADYTIGN